MNIFLKGVFFVMVVTASQFSSADSPQEPTELFRTDGEVSHADSGWTYQAGSEDEMVYVPFEGVYPNKGGRMQSPWFSLPDTEGRGAYYRLTFKAQTSEHCYWWLDYKDANGNRKADCNSKVYPGDQERDYDQVVYIEGAVREVQIAFVSKGKVEASDVRFTTATVQEAAEWADALYATLPPMNFKAPDGSMALLPKTVAAMKNGTPWRVVMLGHSITNDTYNSLFMALVKRDFPESSLEFVPSIRGYTFCSYYRQQEAFTKYAVEKKPDLLILMDYFGNEDFEEVIKMAREQIGCEIAVINMPLAGEWREKFKTLDWRSIAEKSKDKWLMVSPIRECTKKLNVTFWDLTTPCNDYLASVGEIDFTRDYIHNNDVGKQLAGRVLREYFLTAK